MLMTRRQWLAATAALIPAASLAPPAGAAAAQPHKPTRLILLGTKGGPPLARSGRNNTSTMILINDVPYLIDCGYGVARQMIAAGVNPGRTRYIFLTHHHSDHTLEYGALLYQAWLSPRRPEIHAYGPKGIAEMTRTAFDTQKLDIAVRMADEGMVDPRSLVTVHELEREGAVMENADVRVTCCRVRHPPIADSFAFRFDAKDRSIVISGDTAYSPELVRLAKGADVLVHEALYLPAVDQIVARATNAPRLREHIIASHTTTEEVGRVAAEAGVKTLVLSHLIPGDEPEVPDEQWLEGVGKHFKGRTIVGRDLQEI
jgi:ribonuclease BN (tRNA processing enzyme)